MRISPINHVRHASVFPVSEWGARRIDVFGAGALGSHFVVRLAKMLQYPSQIHVWDFDKVMPHNIPNTAFSVSDAALDNAGEPLILKVDALQAEIARQVFQSKREHALVLQGGKKLDPERSIVTHPEGFFAEHSPDVDGTAAFVFVDKMEARKEIIHYICENCPCVEAIFEARMGLYSGRIYTVDPFSDESIRLWDARWYPDKPRDASICNQDPTLQFAVDMLVGRMLLQFTDWAQNALLGATHPIHPELLLDFRSFGLLEV